MWYEDGITVTLFKNIEISDELTFDIWNTKEMTELNREEIRMSIIVLGTLLRLLSFGL
jgi:hypothetical protein